MKHLLTDYNSASVDIYDAYIKSFKQDEKTPAPAKAMSNEVYANLFKKEAKKGLFIDGENITVQCRFVKGKPILVVSYDYHAYKNRVISAYPESVFDFDIVYDGDTFSFSKDSGKVSYTHEKNNPFDLDKKILGAYGIIKNKRGEFIETLNTKDIEKMKKSSTMAFIWDTWFDRMVKKSIIKRICSVAFNDITSDLSKVDNENESPNYALFSQEIVDAIKAIETKEDANAVYKKYFNTLKDERKQFMVLINEKLTK